MSDGYGIVAIDGPAGSGKSTVARRVAARLGLPVLDTGAMYRAVTVMVLERNVAPDDADSVAAVAAECEITVNDTVVCNGNDVTRAIRTPEVDAHVSAVAQNPAVRATLIAQQRRWAHEHGRGVAEGRDMGAVVFPDAAVKVYLTASEAERARRRQADHAAEHALTTEQVAKELERRDATDVPSTRIPVGDATVIDTTGLSIDVVVDRIVALAESVEENAR